AQDLLTALGTEGRRYYARVQLRIDTFYPATYALSRALLLWWLTMPGRLGELEVPFGARIALLLLPVVAAGFDYVENTCIAAMLAKGAEEPLVKTASAATQIKSMASAVTEVSGIVLAAVALHAHWRGSRGRPTL